MIKNRNETSAAMDKALKNLEQAKARYEAERKKENEKRRKAQNHHKYLMGGIVAKYFPECCQYEEKELNVILSAALASAECRQAVENVKRMEKNADEMEDEKDRNGGHADETKTKENSGGYANSKDFTVREELCEYAHEICQHKVRHCKAEQRAVGGRCSFLHQQECSCQRV